MRILVIGAQAAGASAAAKARRRSKDAEIVVYEKSDVTSFGACGLPYFVAHDFDDPGEMISRSVEAFAAAGIAVKTRHEVTGLDPARKTLTVRDLAAERTFEDHYDRLVIATGAAATMPPVAGRDLAGVFTLKTLADGLAVRAVAEDPSIVDVVVVGAGFIGLETAEALLARGKTVRIVHLDDRVLPDLFDREITDVVERELADSRIALHLDETVTAFVGTGRVERVVTDRGEYRADAVIVATGVRPLTRFLAGSGLELTTNGAIPTDAHGRTGLAGVFAAGDCAAVPARDGDRPIWVPLATVANKMGRVVGDNLAGDDTRSSFPGTLATAALRVCGIEAGRTGLSERQARETGATVATAVVHDKNHSNYVAGQASVTVKLVYDGETRRLLGGQIAGGAGAALRIDALAAAIWGRLTVDDLAMLDFLYAPPFARPWDVLNIAGGAAR